ncbi:MAG: DegT/DnrJ/EryC1/StrS family aminotransferase, partial [Lachnospiraceae bacterium]|nr:DegT/DnrJ/EryC1/StrS family aminotransferase [Lachnospiraceae bacterium]
LQAGLLRVKMAHMEEITEEKRAIADKYTEGIKNPLIGLPKVRKGADSVWHQYVIRCKERDRLIEYLKERQIGTIIHYPIPPHMSEAYQYLGFKKGDFPVAEAYADEVLSLPIYNGITKEEQDYVIDALNRF